MNKREFIEKRPHLFWYVKKEDLKDLTENSIVEHVLNYGSWKDVQEMIKLFGLRETAKIFRERSRPDKFGRQNYRPEIKNYFNLYFIIKDHFSISQISEKAESIFKGFDEKLFRSQLAYFEGVNYEEKVEYLPGFEAPDNVIKEKLIEFSISN